VVEKNKQRKKQDPDATDIQTAIEVEMSKIWEDFDFGKYVIIDDIIVSIIFHMIIGKQPGKT
jgi:hypothetical protein